MFSGAGRIAIRAFHEFAIIDPVTGIVDVENTPIDMRPHTCGSGFGNGILERRGGKDFVTYVEDSRVVRVPIDGTRTKETVYDNHDLGDTCGIAIAPTLDRWFLAAPEFASDSLAPRDDAHQVIACPATLTCPDCN